MIRLRTKAAKAKDNQIDPLPFNEQLNHKNTEGRSSAIDIASVIGLQIIPAAKIGSPG